jgi:hypothetical protein
MIWKEVFIAKFKLSFRHSPGGIEENDKNFSTVGVRTRLKPATSPILLRVIYSDNFLLATISN